MPSHTHIPPQEYLIREGFLKPHAGEMPDEAALARLKAEHEKVNAVTFVPTGQGAASSSSNGGAAVQGSKVAIVPLIGPLRRYASYDWWTDTYSRGMMNLASELKTLDNDPSVKSVLLWVDSPGGTVDGTEELAQVVAGMKKPVHAVVAGMCCSAAYWVASQADKIWAVAKSGEIGSIGVLVQHVDYSVAYEQAGIKVTWLTSKGQEGKVVAPVTSPLSEEDREKVTRRLSDIYRLFEGAVKKGRKEVGADSFTGAVFLAEQARTLGLIDGVKTSYEMVFDEVARAGNIAEREAKKDKKAENTSPATGLFNMSLFAGFFGGGPKGEATGAEGSDLATNHDTAQLVFRIGQADAQIKRHEADMKAAQVALEAANTKAAELEAKLTEATSKLADALAAVEGLTAKAEGLETDLKAASDALTAKAAELEAANTKAATAETALATANEELSKFGRKAPEGSGARSGGDADAKPRGYTLAEAQKMITLG